MVAVETAGRFNSGCRRHEGLELVRHRTVWRPGRLAERVRIAGRGEVGPIADHGLGEFLLTGRKDAGGGKDVEQVSGNTEGAPGLVMPSYASSLTDSEMARGLSASHPHETPTVD